jgi:hypothetical protein
MEDAVANALNEVVALRAALDSLERALVVRARSQGAGWRELAGPLGLSSQGVRKRHLQSDPLFARRPARAQTIDEYHAEMVAYLRERGIEV